MAELGQVNLVVADGVSGRVTLHLEDVAWEDAFAALLATEGLGATRIGSMIFVSALP